MFENFFSLFLKNLEPTRKVKYGIIKIPLGNNRRDKVCYKAEKGCLGIALIPVEWKETGGNCQKARKGAFLERSHSGRLNKNKKPLQ
jgi:hypothetical protein